jgi:hypothetical protein
MKHLEIGTVIHDFRKPSVFIFPISNETVNLTVQAVSNKVCRGIKSCVHDKKIWGDKKTSYHHCGSIANRKPPRRWLPGQ